MTISCSTGFFTSAFIQWNSDAELTAVNLRLNYIYKLGSDLFIVYNENRRTADLRPGVLDRSLIQIHLLAEAVGPTVAFYGGHLKNHRQ